MLKMVSLSTIRFGVVHLSEMHVDMTYHVNTELHRLYGSLINDCMPARGQFSGHQYSVCRDCRLG